MGRLPSSDFWRRRRVFLTGHTGFKGGWTAFWLNQLGAEVCGYALPPSTRPSLFEALRIDGLVESHMGDIRDMPAMRAVFEDFGPSIIIHMAAQPLVRLSYAEPLKTYSTNVIGTANVLELARSNSLVVATVVVTTDKCYENREQIWPYREIDRLGGRDPYSSSKACAEMVVSAYWWSYFQKLDRQALSSVRAGNVIGGGDWSKDRLVPDLITAFSQARTAVLRRPESVRPWQHVLEPICGYLLAAERIFGAADFSSPPSWNFGPERDGNVTVGVVADKLAQAWGEGARLEVRTDPKAAHEATLLTLDHTKAQCELGWHPRWPLNTALAKTAEWYRAFYDSRNMPIVTLRQLEQYVEAGAGDQTDSMNTKRDHFDFLAETDASWPSIHRRKVGATGGDILL